MKMRIFTSVLALFMMIFLLAGCTAEAPTPKGGTLYLTVNPVIAVTYDEEGVVTSVTAVSEDAVAIVDSYQDFVGKDCTRVVSELVEKIGQTGYLTEDATISVTFAEGSGTPRQGFAEELEQQILENTAANNWNVTIEVTPPVETVSPSDQLSEQPSTEIALPEGAQPQEDGTYVLEQYVNALLSEVAQNKAEYVMTTVYSADGNVLSREAVSIVGGILQIRETYEYENGVLTCTSFLRYDPFGNFKEHFSKFVDPDGTVLQKVEYDAAGNITVNTAYTYFASGQISKIYGTNTQGIAVLEQIYFESGNLKSESSWYDDGTPQSYIEYDQENRVLSQQTWHENGTPREADTYADGILETHTVYNSDGDMLDYYEYWPSGLIKLRKSLGFYSDGEAVNGWCIYEFAEDGVCLHDVTYWPDGSLCSEFYYYYPSGNIKSIYYSYPSNSYHSAYYGEFRDGASTEYSGWNVINGEKVYFGEAAKENDPLGRRDMVYDNNLNLIFYRATENGYDYEVHTTYDEQNRRLTEKIIGEDGSINYTEYGHIGDGDGGGVVYSEHTGVYCSQDDIVREIFDMRGDTYHYETYYADGGFTIADDKKSNGEPYYLTYQYADGRCEIYEYEDGVTTYMYIECEDGTVITKGTPRGN